MNQEKKLIIFLLIIFSISAACLFWVSEKYQNPAYKKNWWVLYFEDMQGSRVDFVIENYSDKTEFYWEAAIKNKKLLKENAQIFKGERKTVSVDNIEAEDGQKITITVSAGEEKREIYKYQKN